MTGRTKPFGVDQTSLSTRIRYAGASKPSDRQGLGTSAPHDSQQAIALFRAGLNTAEIAARMAIHEAAVAEMLHASRERDFAVRGIR